MTQVSRSGSMADVLARTADEVARCRAVVLRIEEAVHSLCSPGGAALAGAPPGLLADLQAIDYLDQRLDDLARWLAALAPHCGDAPLPGAAARALSALRLADLRHALAGGIPGPAGGVTELF